MQLPIYFRVVILVLHQSSRPRSPLNRAEGKKGKRNPRSTKGVRRIAAAFFSVKFNQGYPSEAIELIRTRLSIISCVFIVDLQMDTADRDVSGGTRKRKKLEEKKKEERDPLERPRLG